MSKVVGGLIGGGAGALAGWLTVKHIMGLKNAKSQVIGAGIGAGVGAGAGALMSESTLAPGEALPMSIQDRERMSAEAQDLLVGGRNRFLGLPIPFIDQNFGGLGTPARIIGAGVATRAAVPLINATRANVASMIFNKGRPIIANSPAKAKLWGIKGADTSYMTTGLPAVAVATQALIEYMGNRNDRIRGEVLLRQLGPGTP